jgi:hypothetical protein
MGESEGDGMRYVWVVEMLDNGKCYPCAGIGIDKDQGKDALRDWKNRNPHDKFRLTKYVPEKEE